MLAVETLPFLTSDSKYVGLSDLTMKMKISLTRGVRKGLQWLSRYSDSLRFGRSGESNPGGGKGEIFRTRPDRPWGPPSLLYNGYRASFPGLKRPGCGVDHYLDLAPESKKE